MNTHADYQEKYLRIAAQTPLHLLPVAEREFIRREASRYRLTLQEIRQLTEIALELNRWNEGSLVDLWPREPGLIGSPRERKKRLIKTIRQRWEKFKSEPGHYPPDFPKPAAEKLHIVAAHKEYLGLGRCPVASDRTRCCNLLTLDAVESCGFDCSYCSIQSFYQGNRIVFDAAFGRKLAALKIDPERVYHIGTGQSSDSLMWGNRYGLLDALIGFARRNPNVILELKTKSKNVAYLLQEDIPPNLICTWSLNTPTIIDHEEHMTATLDERLQAARRIADTGALVGFHLHPMVHYDHWEDDYCRLLTQVMSYFDPAEVAMVSLGTLTFTRSVVNRIRNRDFKSKILRMPFSDADGKLSYPEEVKREMFRCAYRVLEPWHESVFFYLCMENHRVWEPVFGYGYPSNEALEQAMKTGYLAKIERVRRKRERGARFADSARKY